MEGLALPLLVLAFVANLATMGVVAITAGADAASQLKLPEIAIGLGGAIGGATVANRGPRTL
jgi:hypothetical protein